MRRWVKDLVEIGERQCTVIHLQLLFRSHGTGCPATCIPLGPPLASWAIGGFKRRKSEFHFESGPCCPLCPLSRLTGPAGFRKKNMTSTGWSLKEGALVTLFS